MARGKMTMTNLDKPMMHLASDASSQGKPLNREKTMGRPSPMKSTLLGKFDSTQTLLKDAFKESEREKHPRSILHNALMRPQKQRNEEEKKD